MNRPVPCLLGFHSWYGDNALIASVMRCNRCPAVNDKRAAERLDAERARLSALPSGASMQEFYMAALGMDPSWRLPTPEGTSE